MDPRRTPKRGLAKLISPICQAGDDHSLAPLGVQGLLAVAIEDPRRTTEGALSGSLTLIVARHSGVDLVASAWPISTL